MYKILANTLFLGKEVIYLPTCHSTNEVAQDLVSKTDKPEGTIVITDDQSKGKGQRGNVWESEAGKNLTFSLVLKPKFLKAEDQFYLNIISSLAIFDGLKVLIPNQEVEIKWPNDILINRKKVCGILIENRLTSGKIGSSILGIGLNVNQKEFSYPTATSLQRETNREFGQQSILELIIQKLEFYYRQLKKGELGFLKDKYMQNLYGHSSSIKLSTHTEFSGRIVDLDEFGRLIVKSEKGIQTFDFKEVRFVF